MFHKNTSVLTSSETTARPSSTTYLRSQRTVTVSRRLVEISNKKLNEKNKLSESTKSNVMVNIFSSMNISPINTRQPSRTYEQRKQCQKLKTNNNSGFTVLKNISEEKIFMKPPKRIGYYSVKLDLINQKKIYSQDRSALRFCSLRADRERYPISYDVLAGYNRLIDWNNCSNFTAYILRWIVENRENLVSSPFSSSSAPSSASSSNTSSRCTSPDPDNFSINTDIICSRGVLTRIMVTPFEREGWSISATKIGSSIILAVTQPPSFLKNRKPSSSAYEPADLEKWRPGQAKPLSKADYQNMLCYSGFKFEDYITDSTKCFTDLSNGLAEHFICVQRSSLKNHSLLYCSEIDAVHSKEDLNRPIDQMRFVEIKTISETAKPGSFYIDKAHKWWAQSFLSGVDDIVLGLRDELLYVKKVANVETKSLLTSKLFSPKICLNFLDRILCLVKSTAIEQQVTWEFSFAPTTDQVSIRRAKQIDSSIPPWFINEFKLNLKD